jgi:methylated-DNA-[protein]-cysteine S-methyltransferase
MQESCYLNSPVGWIRITADADGITSVDFISDPPKTVEPLSLPHLKEAYKQLTEYFQGERLTFNLPLNAKGTEFQRTVWTSLGQVPFGTTISYKELATRIGRPTATRAVGMANNRNPLPIIVPCHRVIGKDGALIGYGSGLAIKERLLQIEGVRS